jgi:hypothetical protein
VLGYGEITLVLGWPAQAPIVAVKRLPPFRDHATGASYGQLVEEYLGALVERGVVPLPTEFHLTPACSGGGWAGYVVQPNLPADHLAPRILRETTGPEAAKDLLGELIEAVLGCVGRRVGLDAQVSNWAFTPAGLRYLDVTTPLLADATGRTRMDLEVITSPLPGILRPVVRRFVAPGITARYHRPRDVLVDMAGNLVKERLDRWIPTVLELSNAHLDRPIQAREVQRYYRSDAVTWEVMLRMRKADRWWQRRVRHRIYPSLLPHDVQR